MGRVVAAVALTLLPIGEAAADASRRWLLAVGNTAYQEPLPELGKAGADAQRIADALSPALGFDALVLRNLDRRTFEREIINLRQRVRRDDIVVIYFSGHGFQHDGDNFVVPVDAALDDPALLEREATRISWIWQTLAEAQPAVVVLLLDACRTTPVVSRHGQTKALGNQRGLAEPRAHQALVGFAAEAGTVAYEGDVGLPTSVFTSSLADQLGTEDYHLEELLMTVRLQVLTRTGNRQAPMRYGMTTGPVYLRPGPVALAREEAAWTRLSGTRSADDLNFFIGQFPTGRRVTDARARLQAITSQPLGALPTAGDPSAAPGPTPRAETVLEGPLRESRISGGATSQLVGAPSGVSASGWRFRDVPRVFASAGATLRLEPSFGAEPLARVAPTTAMVLHDIVRRDGASWGRVETPDGLFGYVEGVERRVRVPEFTNSISVSVPQGALAPTEGSFGSAADLLGAARALGPRARITIDIPASAAEDPVMGRQTAFIRGLAVREWISQRGVEQEQMVLHVRPAEGGAALAAGSREPGPVTVNVRLDVFPAPPR